ncbi:CFEM domain-containing protein [Stagonosporopsis vannaccii]|nr:CFEM domain-containing protein [Stagonosporopsis vannaccii]
MKLALVSIIIFTSTTLSVLAQGADPTLSLDTLPPCALICLFTAVSHSPCQLADSECICTNAPLQSTVEACVIQSCTVKEGLETKNTTATLCGAPIRNRLGELKRINIALATLSNFSVFVRIISKLTHLNPSYGFGLDDVCLLFATCVGLSNTIIVDQGALPSGLGRDVWTLPFPDITAFARWFYVMEILYFVQLTFLKLALLFFYHRIFPGVRVRRLVWATIAFNIAFGIAFTFAGIFQCRPISHNWTHWDGVNTGGKCININALAWANAAISIAVDVWMLAIPLFQVAKLQMSVRKKIAVSLMFVVGTFVTIVSILRLRSLVCLAPLTNPTWDQGDVTLWSIVEINVGTICACMPTFRSLLAKVLPRIFGSTIGSSHQRQTGEQVQSPYADPKAKIFLRLVESHSTEGSLVTRADFRAERGEVRDDEVELVRLDQKQEYYVYRAA